MTLLEMLQSGSDAVQVSRDKLTMRIGEKKYVVRLSKMTDMGATINAFMRAGMSQPTIEALLGKRPVHLIYVEVMKLIEPRRSEALDKHQRAAYMAST